MKKLFVILFSLCTITFAFAQTRTHIVKRGETYQCIAEKYGISEDVLKSYNISHKTCYVGLKVNVPYSNELYSPPTKTENEYEKFIRIAKAATEERDIESAYQLAKCYENGWGTEIDKEFALIWYQFGYINNHEQSSLELARFYENGIGTKENVPQSLKIYGKLAVNNNSHARSHLVSKGYEEKTWPFLAQYGEVPKFIKEKWEAESRRLEKERKQQAAVKNNKQTVVQHNVQHAIASNNSELKEYVNKSPCVGCSGTGNCQACFYVAFSPETYGGVCPMCYGSRICRNCDGKGFLIAVMQIDNAGNGSWLCEDGNSSLYNGNTSIGNSTAEEPSTKTHGTRWVKCKNPSCVDGYTRDRSKYAAPSAFYPSYHNNGGYNCSICGYSTDHYHYRCPSCLPNKGRELEKY